MHAQVLAATKPALLDPGKSRNYHPAGGSSNTAQVSSIAIWEQPNAPPKIFTGSSDGYWRLWNSAANFAQEFECNMNGKVNQCLVNFNFLFCGFEAISRALPDVPVGMVHAWNLQSPQQPPLELQVQPNLPTSGATTPTATPISVTPTPAPTSCSLPYAHNTTVTALTMAGTDAATVQIASGSRDGTIRLWRYEPSANAFVMAQTLIGHAREVTGLILLPQQNLLWSAGTDNCLRIWNTITGVCQYCITKEQNGHTHAITGLEKFETHAEAFILSSSLDKSVKAWRAATGECVASETHANGIVSMVIAKDMKNHEVLLLGTDAGSILARTLVATPNIPAFSLLFTLSEYGSGAGHNGAVKSLAAGPSATFYSGGTDGKMLVFSFSGDLGIE
jgi:WD40 repeat protein